MKLSWDQFHDEVVDNYAVPQCQALCAAYYRWEDPHPCPWRGRYSRQGFPLCGHHARMATVELVEQHEESLLLQPLDLASRRRSA